MRLNAKVLVVGGGPAGSIAARTLAAWGIDVILLERDLSFEKPCGGGIPLSVFDELDIPKNLIKREVKVIRIISPSGNSLDIDLQGGILTIIKRDEFDKALRGKAEKEGAEIIEAEVILIKPESKYYKVEAIVKGTKREIMTEYIIAADGVNSRVKSSLGIKPAQAVFTASEKIKELKTDFCEFWLGSSHAIGFYSWFFPATEGISAGTGSIEPGKVSTLFERFKKRRGISKGGLKRIYRIPIWKGDVYNKGKVLFAGDSACQVMPLSYEGIYYAMKSGEFAARAIIEDKAENYKKIWKAKFQKRFTLMDTLKKHFLKNDLNAERFVALHRRPEVQEASMRLWLRKDRRSEVLHSYIKLFSKFIC